MSRFRDYIMLLPAEEKANTITHFLPLIGALVLAYPIIRLAYQSQCIFPNHQLFATILFVAGMLLMYSSSTLYHVTMSPSHKARLRIFDHISIFAMIAGSYSPVCLCVVGGWLGWTVFGFQWACVIAGIVGKLVALGKFPKLSLLLYLAMGWVALLVIVPMWRNMSHAAFSLVVLEGIFYTIGAYFFNKDEQHAYYHAIWHVFIVLGTISHTIATWLILSN